MLTNASFADKEYVPGSSRSPRNTATLRLQLLQAIEQQELMDDQRKREIGARIKDLRENSPYTQQVVASRVGVTLRAFQKWEQGRGITYDNVERVATVFGVEPDYILKGPAPTPLRAESDGMPPLGEIERLVREVLSRLDGLEQLVGRVDQLEERLGLLHARQAASDLEALARHEEVLRAIRRQPPGEQRR